MPDLRKIGVIGRDIHGCRIVHQLLHCLVNTAFMADREIKYGKEGLSGCTVFIMGCS